MSRDHVRPAPRALVVSPCVGRRTAHAQVLEEQGLVVSEATSADEAFWLLMSARVGDAPPLEVVVVDVTTPGVPRLKLAVNAGEHNPALVLVGAPVQARAGVAAPAESPSPTSREAEERLRRTHPTDGGAPECEPVITHARRPDDLASAIKRALAHRGLWSPKLRVLMALHGSSRRAEARASLSAAGASVVDVDDGLELLEVLGANLALAPVAWAPELLVMDARLDRLDGLDALAEIRELDVDTPAVLLAAHDDLVPRSHAARLRARVLDADVSPSELTSAVIAARPLASRLARPLRAA